MFKSIACLVTFFLPAAVSFSQEKTYSPAQLQEDFRYLRKQMLQVHANPYSKFTKERYNQYLDSLEAGFTAPMSTADFQRKAAAALLPLDDEHSRLSDRNTPGARKEIDYADSVATNISYTRYGNTGYINARSFGTRPGRDDMQVYERNIDSIFNLIKRWRQTPAHRCKPQRRRAFRRGRHADRPLLQQAVQVLFHELETER